MAKATPTDPPRISVLERRLQNPFGEPAKEVQLKAPNIMARWFNDDAQTGQIYRAKQLGWQDVTMDMVRDKESIGHYALNPAGQISRGPRGQEILMWMPLSDYQRIQMAKTKINLDKMNDWGREQRDMLNAAGQTLGSEAADYLETHTKTSGYVRNTRERIAVNPTSEEEDDRP